MFRHVVFDMNGDYYVAVPLYAPPGMNPTEREELRVESQLLANLFASFEREKIFKRTMPPTTGSIQAARAAGLEIRGLGIVWRLQVRTGRLVRHHPRCRDGRGSPRRSGRGRRSEHPRSRFAEPARRALPDAQRPSGKPQRQTSNATPHRPRRRRPSIPNTQCGSAPTLKRIGPIRRRHPITRHRVPGEHPPRSPKQMQRSKPQQQYGANGPIVRRPPAIGARPARAERDTPRRPTTTQILNQFASWRGRASRCSGRRRFSCAGKRSRHPRLTQSGIGWC